MNVSGGRVDMGVAEQSLHYCEVDAGLGQGSAEGVPECMGVTAGHAGGDPVVTKDRAQARWREGLAPGRTLGHHEQPWGARRSAKR